MRVSAVALLSSLSLLIATPLAAQVYSGSFTRPSNGSSTAFKIYVPEWVDSSNLRGAMVWGNGTGEDRRYMCEVPWVQAFARVHKLAVIGFPSGFDGLGSGVKTTCEEATTECLKAAATLTGRASLANAPVLAIGMSAGGLSASAHAAVLPSRLLGFASNKGVHSTNIAGWDSTANGACQVIGVIIPGEDDSGNTPNPYSGQTHYTNWRSLQSNTGRVSYALDYNSDHMSDTGQSWDLACVVLSESSRLRHPGTPLSTTVGVLPTLNSVSTSGGWLAERAVLTSAPTEVYNPGTGGTDFTPAGFSNRPTFPNIAPYGSYSGTPAASNASWLPSEMAARAYRAFTCTDATDTNRKEAPINTWLQIETPARYQQYRAGETPTVTVDTRQWSGVTSYTYYHFREGTLVSSQTTASTSYTLTALAAGFHVVIVEATDGTNQRAAFVTFTAEDTSSVPSNTWVGATSRDAALTANWSNGLPATGNRRMTTFNADTAQNTDYATNGDLRVSHGSMSADPYYYGLDFPPAASSRGWQFIGWRYTCVGPGGIWNRDPQTVTFDMANGRLSTLSSQTWTAEAGDLVFTQNGTFTVNLTSSEGRNAFLTLKAETGRTITVSAPITGSGGIVKSGLGLAILGGVNTFKDPVYYFDSTWQETIRVDQGTLRLGTGASLGSTNRLFVSAGTATFDLGGNAVTLAALTGGGNVALGSTGLLTLAHTYEESVGATWSPTDWRGCISGGTPGQDSVSISGTLSSVDTDSSGSVWGLGPGGTTYLPRMGGNNSYQGRTLITSGKVNIVSNNAFGSTGSGNETVVSANAVLAITGTGLNVPEDLTFNTTNNATMITNASGSGDNTLSGTLRIPAVESAASNLDALLLNEAANSTLTLSGTLTGQDWTTTGTGKARLFLRGGTNTVMNVTGVIANGGNGVLSLYTQKQGSTPTSPTFRLANTNTFTGGVSHLGGTLLIATNAPSGSPGALGNATGNVTVGASWGTTTTENIAVLTEGSVTVGRPFAISTANSSASTTIGGSTAHASTFSGDLRVQGSRDVRLTAASGGTVTFTGTLREETSSTQTASFTKVGPGAVVLARAAGNTYVGGTTVSEGTLLANNTSGSATGTGAVTVASGASLGGTGIISGAVTVQAGGALTFSVSTAPGSHDKLELGSTLNLSAAESLTITVPVGGAPATGTYTLLTASGGITGAINTLNLPSGWNGSVAVNGNNLDLTVTSLPAVPAAPGAPGATAVSQTHINLTWADAASETAYIVQRSLTSGSGYTNIATLAANTTSYSDTGLTAGTTYYYRVLAANNGGTSAAASVSTATLENAPTPPSGLTATSFDHANVDLSWTDNASNESGFKIERSTTSGSGFTLVATVSANVTTYRDSGRSPLTTYYYRVSATNTGGDSPYTSEASTTTPSDQLPATPGSFAVYVAGDTQNLLTWTDTTADETGFKVERKTGAGSFSEIATVAANATSYSDTGLTPGAAYTYRIRSTNAVGDSNYTAQLTPAVPAWNVDASGSWTTLTNWTSSFAPNAVGASVTLGNGPATATALRTLTLDADTTIGTLTANATLGLSSAGYILSTSTNKVLTFDVTSGNAALTNPSDASALRISNSVVLNDNLNLTAASTGDTGSAGSTASVYLSGGVSGAGGITKLGTGTLRLNSGTGQTFSGGVTLSQGTVILGTPSSGLSINALGTGTLTLNNANTHAISHNNFKYSGAFTPTLANPATLANAVSLNVAHATNSFANWSIDTYNPAPLKFTGAWSSTAPVTSDLIMNTGGATGMIYAGDATGLTFSGAGRFWFKSGHHFIGAANALGSANGAPIRLGRDAGGDSVNSEAGLYLLGNYTASGSILLAATTSCNAANRLRLGAITDAVTGTFSGPITLNQAAGQDSARTVEIWAGPAGAPSSTTITFGGAIADGAGVTNRHNLIKYGRGTAIFAAANSHAGTLTVADGTLLINGNASAATGALTVAGPISSVTKTFSSGGASGATSFVITDATASGVAVGMAVTGTNIQPNTFVRSISAGTINITMPTTGQVAGSITFSDLAGGTLGGTGTIGGAVALQSGGQLAFAISTGPATHDRLDINGALSLAGSNTITITSTCGASPGTYTLLTAAGGITGPLPTLALPVNWTATLEQSGNNLNLVVTGTGAPIETWRQTHFASKLDAGTGANTADPDGDGLSNLLEYALGTNPNARTSGATTVSTLDDTGSKYLVLEYKRPQTAPADVTYIVESCSALTGWASGTGATTPVSTTNNGDGTLTIRVCARRRTQHLRPPALPAPAHHRPLKAPLAEPGSAHRPGALSSKKEFKNEGPAPARRALRKE